MDILNPDVFVDAKMLEDTVKGNQGSRGENGSDDIGNGFFVAVDVGDEGVIKNSVGDGGHQAAMEARVVAPKTGVRVDGDDSRDNLRSQEEKNGEVELGADELETVIYKRLDQPDSSDEDGHQIDEEHFVELKDFGGVGPEDQRSCEEEDVEKPAEDLGVDGGGFRLFGHDVSLTFNLFITDDSSFVIYFL